MVILFTYLSMCLCWYMPCTAHMRYVWCTCSHSSVATTQTSCFCNTTRITLRTMIPSGWTCRRRYVGFLFRKYTSGIRCFSQMGCCGLSGPQTYLDYLRKVPAVCYRQGVLVTRGCEYVVYDAFQGVHQLSKLLIWLALGIELVTLLLYMRLIIRKYRYLICRIIVAYNDFKRYWTNRVWLKEK